MRSVVLPRQRGRPPGPAPLLRDPARFGDVLARALPIACALSPTGAALSALGWLDGLLVECRDQKGRPYIAARLDENTLDGRAGNILKRAKRPRTAEERGWLVAAAGLLAAWIAQRCEGRDTATARGKLAALDPEWPAILDRLDHAIAIISSASPQMQTFERQRLPKSMAEIVKAFRYGDGNLHATSTRSPPPKIETPQTRPTPAGVNRNFKCKTYIRRAPRARKPVCVTSASH